MKTRSFFISAAWVILACSVLAACNLFGGDTGSESAPDAPEVTIRAAENAATSRTVSRTVLPEASAYVSSYAFSGVGPGTASFDLVSTQPWLRTHLEPGRWEFSVSAMNDSGLVLLVGSLSVSVEAGSAVDVPIQLSPRPGKGSVSVAFRLPAELPPGTKIEVRLEPFDGSSPVESAVIAPFPALVLPEVPSGYYALSALMSGSAGLAEVVRVLPDSETALQVDFASIPGSAVVSALPFNGDPIGVRLPPWTHRAADLPLTLAALTEPSSAELSWRLDGRPVPGAELSAPLPLGLRRLDALVSSSAGRRGGSAGRLFESLPGAASGPFRWAGAFSSDAPFAAALPAANGFPDVAVSDGGSRIFALDGPDPDAKVSIPESRSSVHVFTLSDRGVPFQTDVFTVRSAGTLRSCDGIAVSPDGSRLGVWKSTTSWIAFRSSDLADPAVQFAHVDHAVLGGSSSSAVKSVAFSADSRQAFALVSSPHRVLCLSVEGAVPSLLWTRPLEDTLLPASISFQDMAVHSSGSILVTALSADVAVLLSPSVGGAGPAEIAKVFRRTVGGPSWLEGPVSCASVQNADSPAAAEFLVLCSDSGTVGRVGFDATGVAFSEPLVLGRPELLNAESIAMAPGRTDYAVLGSGQLLFGHPSAPFPAAAFPRSAALPALASTSSVAWVAAGRFLAADSRSRSLSLFEAIE